MLAGLLNPEGTGLSCTLDELLHDMDHALFTGNTTLGVVVTNVKFPKHQLSKIAGMTHNGYARPSGPVHTTADGDRLYALSVASSPAM